LASQIATHNPTQEEHVDDKRFDNLTRRIGAETSRRTMIKTAAGGTLAVLGLGSIARVTLGQDVSAEDQGFKGDDCDKNSDCKKGLVCKDKNDRKRCEYKSNCGGKKNQACKNNGDCCKNKNLKCKNRKCKRTKKN
jgi:hypothetical protein